MAADGAVATAPISRFAAVPPPLKETFTKLEPMESHAPLSAFQTAAGSKPFEPQKLAIVRLKFDRTSASVICISGVGFGR